MSLVETQELARRLARTIVSDIALYNQAKVKEGIEHDDLFDVLKDEIEEGGGSYTSAVWPPPSRMQVTF